MTNPNHWFSDRLNRYINLHDLSKDELIDELMRERVEYFAFETAMSAAYGFKKRVFPDRG